MGFYEPVLASQRLLRPLDRVLVFFRAKMGKGQLAEIEMIDRVERIVQPDSDAPVPEETVNGAVKPDAEQAPDLQEEVRDEGPLAIEETANGEPAPPELPEEESTKPSASSQE